MKGKMNIDMKGKNYRKGKMNIIFRRGTDLYLYEGDLY